MSTHSKGGTFVWANKHVFDPYLRAHLLSGVSTQPIDIEEPTITKQVADDEGEDLTEEKDGQQETDGVEPAHDDEAENGGVVEPLHEGALTLSGVPQGKLQAILYLEQSRERNKPFEVTAGEPGLRLTREQIDSIAQVVTNDGSTPRLQSPAGYRLNCSCDDLERIKNETNGGDGFIVRTVPLFVDTGVEEEEVEQLCPVLIRCEPPTGTDTAGCDAIDQEMSSVSSRDALSLVKTRP
ncbi:unnamed protein product [Vitrella brassicaformis CCMP3155]|uniref:Uncharacterized protein n=1 Tax=Vitrella brassicaformis (strain CCMP3155) TaxID=1169540 RepID=A0A0G4EK96_VITBC|nr:unnamed protein product [Vitrella brassicaformis CCMP3155]|eukprot:CEL97870.1 unnamed protein product [Vitrella brassicaformis CCMP3155]